MAPVKQMQYRFSPESIAELRKRLGLSQAALARALGVPPNTVSRWENGATTPDAASLAAIYSIAMERGIRPSFFMKRRKQAMARTQLLVVWDFQRLPVLARHVQEMDEWLTKECDRRFSATTQRNFKAFVRSRPLDPLGSGPASTLDDLDWDIWEDREDLEEDIIHHCKSDCGQDPLRTILVLIAKDGNYADMINDLKESGVRVYLLGVGFGQDLTKAVGEKRLINLPWPNNAPRLLFNDSYHPWLDNRIGGWAR